MKRQFVQRDRSQGVEHPAGGVFHIRPLLTRELLRYREDLERRGIVVDGDEVSGVEVKVRSDLKEFEDLIEFVGRRVERVSEIVDATTGEELPSTAQLVEDLLWQIWENEDGKRELVATWVLGKAVDLGNGRKADEIKN